MTQTRTWEGGWGSKTATVAIDDKHVLVAADCGPRGQPVGATLSHQEFLEGRYQPVVKQVFGDEVLQEMLDHVQQIAPKRAQEA